LYFTSPESPKVRESQFPFRQWGVKPTVSKHG
jgi:hypothetical protein